MYRVQSISAVPNSGRPVFLATGCFDGVHRGHQQVIATAVERAAACGGEAWVFTFKPHPAKVLSPETAPPLISAEPCRMRQFEALGVDGIIEIPFDAHYAQTGPSDFFQNLIAALPSLRGIACGADWSFGFHANGHFDLLDSLCRQHGIEAIGIQPVLFDGEKISSTRIRRAVIEGRIPLAEQLLGRPFSVFGPVVRGCGTGRDLGFPTANIEPLNELLPAAGVYAGRLCINGTDPVRLLPGAVFIGQRRTFNDSRQVVEVHLPGFEGDLYGCPVELRLVQKVRDTRTFSSAQELAAQIQSDVATILAILSSDTSPQVEPYKTEPGG